MDGWHCLCCHYHQSTHTLCSDAQAVGHNQMAALTGLMNALMGIAIGQIPTQKDLKCVFEALSNSTPS